MAHCPKRCGVDVGHVGCGGGGGQESRRRHGGDTWRLGSTLQGSTGESGDRRESEDREGFRSPGERRVQTIMYQKHQRNSTSVDSTKQYFLRTPVNCFSDEL